MRASVTGFTFNQIIFFNHLLTSEKKTIKFSLKTLVEHLDRLLTLNVLFIFIP